ncbi:hypothetical protein A0H81_12581 [Grifola frondosa]|uniref:Uncharacterized protein n=1 Tax=Grifola frondosa TaxID=5627 RepID=A0A1C7LT50_GRIFR|nr:hypothetical protein A0H81_12581 [Grifola frondosa]
MWSLDSELERSSTCLQDVYVLAGEPRQVFIHKDKIFVCSVVLVDHASERLEPDANGRPANAFEFHDWLRNIQVKVP